MKILLTTQPGLGSLHPMIPVVQALQQRGHEVAFACSRSLCPRIERLGIRAFPAGLDWLESETERLFPQVRDLSLKEIQLWYMTEIFSDIAAHRSVPDLLEIARAWQPDIIVRNEFEFASCVVAELLSIPQATLGVDVFLSERFLEPLIGEQLAYLRSSFGLPAYPALDMLYPSLYMSFMTPGYQLPGFAQLPVAHALRPLIFDQSGDEQAPAWLIQRDDRPVVCVSLGTVLNRVPDIFQTLLEGLRDEPIRLILTIGDNQDPAQFGPQPPNVYIERYIPHTLLFPHCDLMITSGSVGTVKSLIWHTIPMLLIPLFATQPVHALMSVRQGVARALRYADVMDDQPAAQTWPQVSPAGVRDAVRAMLADPSYREHTRRLRAQMLQLPGPERAVELLERLAAQRSPLHAFGLPPA